VRERRDGECEDRPGGVRKRRCVGGADRGRTHTASDDRRHEEPGEGNTGGEMRRRMQRRIGGASMNSLRPCRAAASPTAFIGGEHLVRIYVAVRVCAAVCLCVAVRTCVAYVRPLRVRMPPRETSRECILRARSTRLGSWAQPHFSAKNIRLNRPPQTVGF
jgi:hypothetical protein